MAGFNRIILVGNLTRDPEYKQLANGQAVCRLGLASNRQFKNRQTGTLVQEVCYVDVDVWGAQADTSRQYLSKGRPVLVEGRLKLDSWQDGEGNNRSKHSIVADRVVFLGATSASEDSSDEKMAIDDQTIEQVKALVSKKEGRTEGAHPTRRVAKKIDAQPTTDLKLDEQPFSDDLPF